MLIAGDTLIACIGMYDFAWRRRDLIMVTHIAAERLSIEVIPGTVRGR